jgi:hypothetical protein
MAATTAAPPSFRAKPFITTKVPLPSQRIHLHRPSPVPDPVPPPVKISRPKVAPHEFPEYDTERNAGVELAPSADPKDLFQILEIAPFARITFPDENKLQRFRHNLYAVNVEGRFRYATRREGWTSLIVLRLK